MTFWTDLIDVDKSAPLPSESQAFEQGAWISGRIAMHPTPSWETPGLAQFASFGWDVSPWPPGPAGQESGSFGSGFGITKNSDNPDEAWTFLSEYLSTDGMIFMWGSTGRGSPARKDAYPSWIESEDAPANASAYLEALDTYAVTGRPYQTLGAAELIDIVNRQTDLLKSGDVNIDTAIANIMADGTPVLQAATERDERLSFWPLWDSRGLTRNRRAGFPTRRSQAGKETCPTLRSQRTTFCAGGEEQRVVAAGSVSAAIRLYFLIEIEQTTIDGRRLIVL